MQPPIAAEARLESVLQVAVPLVRMIDPAAREIAVVEAGEIVLAIAAWEAVLGIGVPLEIPDTAAAARAQAAVEVLQASAVRVGAMAEQAVEVVVEAVVVEVVVGGGRPRKTSSWLCLNSSQRSLRLCALCVTVSREKYLNAEGAETQRSQSRTVANHIRS